MRNRKLWVDGLAILMLTSACGGSDTATTTTTPPPPTTEVAEEEIKLALAEEFVDAFYSFEAGALQATLAAAESSQPGILFYQGWAQGANYRIVDRQPCELVVDSRARCSVTVEDDLAKTLDIGFNVTDTFDVRFRDGQLVGVDASSDDPPVVRSAFQWVNENKPELFENGQPCEGFFNGGPTPGECAVVFVAALGEYLADADGS